jgi:predicted nucleic acid-binding protein
MGMVKTPVEIDEEALATAAEVLGTKTKKDTVNAALREVGQRLARLRALAELGVSPALYLIDTSGLFRILQDKLRRAWADQLAAGVIAVCPVVALEFLYSARSLADRLAKKRLLREVFGRVPMSDRAYERAEEVQQLLAEVGRHRSAGPIDLLIAATAERERLTILCDDRDYQTVASVTGQPVKLVTDVNVAPVFVDEAGGRDPGSTGDPAARAAFRPARSIP